jgi:hypothetical protein
LLASTDWVPFDLGRSDLLQCLEEYSLAEARGELEYTFRHPDFGEDATINAQAALSHFRRTGSSPLSKWQSHLFEFRACNT